MKNDAKFKVYKQQNAMDCGPACLKDGDKALIIYKVNAIIIIMTLFRNRLMNEETFAAKHISKSHKSQQHKSKLAKEFALPHPIA